MKHNFEQFNKLIINSPRLSFKNVIQSTFDGFLVLKELIDKDIIKNVFKTIEFTENILKSQLVESTLIKKKSKRERRFYIELFALFGLIESYKDCKFVSLESLKITNFSEFKLYISSFLMKINLKNWSFLRMKTAKIFYKYDSFIFQELIEYSNNKPDFTEEEVSIIFGYLGEDNQKDQDKWKKDMILFFKNIEPQNQKKEFLKKMNWEKEKYKSSQEPWFKFKLFLIILKELKLIKKIEKKELNTIINTEERNNANIKYTQIQTYKRSALIKKQRLVLSGYVSDFSGKFSFIKSNGNNYVEVHHIIPLSLGGLDSLENTTSLTADEHRSIHLSKNSNIELMNKRLMNKLKPKIELMVHKELLKDKFFIEKIKYLGIYG